MGYHMAGFRVIGIDLKRQPAYPFEFHQADIRDITIDWIRRHDAQALTGSPPCKLFTSLAALHPNNPLGHVNLIPDTRDLFRAAGLPWVMENVPGSPLMDPVQICGSALGLRVRRHRLFETNFPALGTPCNHAWQDLHRGYQRRISKAAGRVQPSGTVPVFGNGGQMLFDGLPDARRELLVTSAAMGIDWMSAQQMSQAIPPAYALHMGRQLMERVNINGR